MTSKAVEMKPIEIAKVEKDLFVLRTVPWNILTFSQQHEITIDLALAIIGLFNKIESLEQRACHKEN